MSDTQEQERKKLTQGEFEIPLRDTNTYLERPNGYTEPLLFVLLLFIGAIFLGLLLSEIKC